MFGSTILEIMIGMVFVYWLMSLMCYAFNELLAWIFSWRAEDLRKNISTLLGDPEGSGLADKLFSHGLIKSLKKNNGKNPSYIPADTFALVLTDLLTPEEKRKGAYSLVDIRETVTALPNEKLKQSLLALIDNAKDDIVKAKENIEKWFNAFMERASGWYKRKTQLATIVIAVVLTGIFNVDSIRITTQLAKDNTLRAVIVAEAEQEVAAAQTQGELKTQTSVEKFKELKTRLHELGLPLGWGGEVCHDIKWGEKILGLLLTMLAVSLGAPFWFDIMTKFVNLRMSGKKPQTPEKPKEDKP